MQTVAFTAMRDGTRKDYELLSKLEHEYHKGTAERLLNELALQGKASLPGYRITRLEHALQTATRALNDGADTDWIVAGVLHDIGDGLAPQNHDRFAAEIVRPFLREECTWVVENHGAFQMYFYAHHLGWNQNERDRHKGHPCYQSCADFCERWDQTSFDPDYDTKPLSCFAPMVREVFARKAWDEQVIQAGVVKGLPPRK